MLVFLKKAVNSGNIQDMGTSQYFSVIYIKDKSHHPKSRPTVNSCVCLICCLSGNSTQSLYAVRINTKYQ